MNRAAPPPPSAARPPRFWDTTSFRAAAVATLALAVSAILVVAFVTRSTNDAMSRATIEALDREGAALNRIYAQGKLDQLTRAIQERIAAGDMHLYRLTDATQRVVAGNLHESPALPAESSGGGTFRYNPQTEGAAAPSRLAAARVFSLANGLTLIVGRDIEQQRSYLAATNRTLGIGIALLALVGLAAGVLLSRHILKRVDAMTAASRSIMAGNLTQRLPRTGTDDELDRLATSLNTMLDRIELLMAGMKEVSDNIAHDLKTPLNRLRNRAEAALADQRGSPAWRAGLEHAIEDADELMKTFNALLLIARLEAGAIDDTMGPVEVAAMVEDLAELYEPAAEEAGLGLTWHNAARAPVHVRANRQLLGQAIANLIENAIKYAAPANGMPLMGTPSAVAVSLALADDHVEITVADRGPGIAEEDRERAIRRFVRLEASRTKPGTGLGLSLVAAVARLHDGMLRLEDNKPGLRAVLSLPMMAAAAGGDAADSEPQQKKDERAWQKARAN
ncbi:ATP-binding protein [Hyphomicrobium sp. CS1BSMeth3]|uniref:sensor histidine kinase n=1 Tax=Hyphomicrobium sp. CS1BSMeth3 TaxID=1892844 RepID=UPI0009301EC7|nr:ATP-binding protein [Hyphomicrobium sp. CS1BSMeth3]